MSEFVLTEPGLFTDQQNPYDLAALVRHGFRWMAFQVQNDTQVIDRNLAAPRGVGLLPAVWGVTYDQANFYRDGELLGRQADRLGAAAVIVDAEECLKFTRAQRGAQPIVDGVRDGGWTGPVHLSTLGAPANWAVNDFAMDTDSFTATGGGVLPQAYLNDASEYHPDFCVAYWKRVGLADSQLNVTGALYTGKLGRINGAQWVLLLNGAGVRRNFSMYMAQHGTEPDYEALEALAKAPAPPPVLVPSAFETRQQMTATARKWEAVVGPQRLARITVAKRIVGPASTDARWNGVSRRIAQLLDEAGVV